MMASLLIPRAAIALVWLYQGLWCKLLDRPPHRWPKRFCSHP